MNIEFTREEIGDLVAACGDSEEYVEDVLKDKIDYHEDGVKDLEAYLIRIRTLYEKLNRVIT
jgi:hypothetical protein